MAWLWLVDAAVGGGALAGGVLSIVMQIFGMD